VDQQESVPQHVAEWCELRSRLRTRASDGGSATAGIDRRRGRIPADDAFLDWHGNCRANEAKTQENESSLKNAGVNLAGMRGLRLA